MRRPGWLAALVLVAGAMPAGATEVVESVFQVAYTHEGTEYVLADRVVPLLPENACYNWYLRLSEAETSLRFVERFTLPVAVDWGTTGDSPDDVTQIELDGKLAVTTIEVTTDGEGWLSHGWCVAEGDPAGEHLIDVLIDGVAVASFPFTVVPGADYAFPASATYPDRAARTVRDSW